MSSSREESPDWLRSFQAPAPSALTLSSGSEASPHDSPTGEDTVDHEKTSSFQEKEKDRDTAPSKTLKVNSPNKRSKSEHTPVRKKRVDSRSKREGSVGDGKDAEQETTEKVTKPHALSHSVWTLSSDSEPSPDDGPIREDNIHHEDSAAHKKSQYPEKEDDKDAILIDGGGDSPFNEASKWKSPKKQLKTEDQMPTKEKKLKSHKNRKGNDGDMEVLEEEITEKHIEPHLSSSRLPLVFSEKVHRSKALVECEGESIDLSGDMGAVGRMVISDNPSRNQEMFLDLKGTIYKTTIVPSRTFCVVSFGQSEAKIEAIMNDFIQLKPESNVYEAETMVEGTLDGFSFDSEDEADKMPKAIGRQTEQDEGTEEKSNGKTKAKAQKAAGAARKRSKTAGGKPTKKVKKKTQAPKKTKARK
ncbi:hypothetical protein F0562_031057 [Nyssa sinensis]|uniref:DNA-binding protein BIN4 n=1 Tax=Nyssa sinensis TaxID=561372 RepID=A0A5J5AT43_9ASTE|nr:hypothetical protein F0562_031057 [Nyssa sinensis]